MPRNYRKKIGPGGYQRYEEQILEKAVKAVKEKKLTLRQAEDKYGIPRSTLSRKAHDLNPLNIGAPPVLDENEENFIMEGISKCADWGVPLTTFDVRLIVKNYLDSRGKNERRFKNNTPGYEWVRSFLDRRQGLSLRLCQNIKRNRAAVTRKTIKEYFDNLRDTLSGVPVGNIVNFDETNFCDDPGVSKVVVRRGAKHPERVIDSSKCSTSVMFAAAADGQVLPPYVVYKAQHLYPTWVEGGLPGSAYNRNKTGWFDLEIFEDWFKVIYLPFARKLDGEKVLLGDNLSGHLSPEVIRLCNQNNIRFAFLPPNSTHLCQPLDVAFFGPLKRAWRAELLEWKKSHRGVLPKAEFPRLLKNAVEAAGGLQSQNVVSGFSACGVFPFDPDRVLNKIPDSDERNSTDEEGERERSWTDGFVKHLSQIRRPAEAAPPRARGKRMDIAPGKSVVIPADEDETETDEDSPGELDLPEDSSESEAGPSHQDEDSPPAKNGRPNSNRTSPPTYSENDFVVVSVDTDSGTQKYYLAKISKKIRGGNFTVEYLRSKKGKKENYFVFPDIHDIAEVSKTDIILKVAVKDLRRGRYARSGADDFVLE